MKGSMELPRYRVVLRIVDGEKPFCRRLENREMYVCIIQYQEYFLLINPLRKQLTRFEYVLVVAPLYFVSKIEGGSHGAVHTCALQMRMRKNTKI
jgi:hypothetical protein